MVEAARLGRSRPRPRHRTRAARLRQADPLQARTQRARRSASVSAPDRSVDAARPGRGARDAAAESIRVRARHELRDRRQALHEHRADGAVRERGRVRHRRCGPDARRRRNSQRQLVHERCLCNAVGRARQRHAHRRRRAQQLPVQPGRWQRPHPGQQCQGRRQRHRGAEPHLPLRDRRWPGRHCRVGRHERRHRPRGGHRTHRRPRAAKRQRTMYSAVVRVPTR